MTPAEELEQIERNVERLGEQMEAQRKRALEILNGRVAVIRGNRFRIEDAKIYFGGGGARLFFGGPRLKVNGERWANARESSPLRVLDSIEPAG